MVNGTVKWYNTKKGYGFVTPEDGSKEIFVHSSGITKANETDMPSLNEGDKVTFDLQDGQKGPECHNVVVTEKAPPKERAPRPRPAYGGGGGGGFRGYPSGDNEEGEDRGGYGGGGGYSRGGGGGGYSRGGGGGGRSFDRGGNSRGGGGGGGYSRGGKDQKGRSTGRKRR